MQLDLIPQKDLPTIKALSLGGTSLKTRRKIERPLFPGKITHVVFKSSKAKGDLSFYKNKVLVEKLLREKSKKFFIEIIDWVNMGNHLHLKVRFKDKKRMGQFLKSFSATLARAITGARKGIKFGKFWDGLVYTRTLLTESEELGLSGYFEGDHRQRELSYREQERYLRSFNQFLYRLKRVKARPQNQIQFE
ncbi:MAG TPA: transposase [Bdellovibrio sp.]|nr:transposase [Bdellovibrio sp.]